MWNVTWVLLFMVGPWRRSRERIRDIWGIDHRQSPHEADGGKSRAGLGGLVRGAHSIHDPVESGKRATETIAILTKV